MYIAHMQVKHFYYNAILILFYRKIVCQYGMWDQVRVDHGTEFYLTLYIQGIGSHRRNIIHAPFLQTRSTQVYKCCNIKLCTCT